MRLSFAGLATIASTLLLALPAAADVARAVAISAAERDDAGFLVHKVESPFQAGTTDIRVLLPDNLEKDRRYPVVYLLPVEPRRESQYGDGLLEVKKRGLHNVHKALFVAPSFSHLPWYADHPTDPEIRQETYFLKVVLPFIERNYPAVAESEGRRLLGFSKSGWGAWSLLLRHPDVFGRAAAWDAPLDKAAPDQFGMADIFATAANFQKYQVSVLLKQRGEQLRAKYRLMLLGFGNFREQHLSIHGLLLDLKIPHEYRDGPKRKHDWHSGWVPEALELLMAPNAG